MIGPKTPFADDLAKHLKQFQLTAFACAVGGTGYYVKLRPMPRELMREGFQGRPLCSTRPSETDFATVA